MTEPTTSRQTNPRLQATITGVLMLLVALAVHAQDQAALLVCGENSWHLMNALKSALAMLGQQP